MANSQQLTAIVLSLIIGEGWRSGNVGQRRYNRHSMRQLWQRYALVFCVATAVFLSLLLYWPTLRLPIIYDSILHIRIVKGLNLASVWLPTEAFGFYRPLTFLPILLIKAAFGYYPAWLFHGFNVVQHALNAVLLVWLVWRLRGGGRRALLAGLVFAVYPFSYQAIAVYGHNVHPTIANFMLLGLHCYLNGMRLKQKRWWGVTAVFAFLSLLTHESGILLGVLAFLLHWHETGKRPSLTFRAPWLWLLLWGIAYFALYQFLPIARAPQATAPGDADLLRSGLYLLQGLVFPLAWFAPYWPGDGRYLILLGFFAVLAPTIWLLRRPPDRPALALAWGWWALAAALIGLALPTGYLLHGPRLLYLSAVGVALLWALLLDRLLAGKVGIWVGTAVAVFILLISAQFVRARLHDYARLTAPVTDIAAVMAEKPASDAILVVNLPQWLAPPQNHFPLGVEFVAILGDYLFVEELLGENLRHNHPAQATTLPALLRETPYAYGLHRQTPLETVQWSPASGAQHVFLVEYTEKGPRARYTGAVSVDTAVSAPLATFGPYQLLRADCQTKKLTFTWQVTGPVPPTISLFVQALDAQSQLVAQADGPPLGIPADVLPDAPLFLQDLRTLDGAETAVDLLVGAYDYLSGERLPAQSSTGHQLPDNALRLTLPTCAIP